MTGKRKRSEKDVSRVKRNTAQKALQYEAMTDTGICVLGDGHYSVTLKLEDIDYQLALRMTSRALLSSMPSSLTLLMLASQYS